MLQQHVRQELESHFEISLLEVSGPYSAPEKPVVLFPYFRKDM